MAGATLQWLRDNLGLLEKAAYSEQIASEADKDSGVYLVPAFQGLGAPYWRAEARGAIIGLSRAAGRAEIVRAGLESTAYQSLDLIGSMVADMEAAGLQRPSSLRVDGGMTVNYWLMQFLSDILEMPVEVAEISEMTARGAAYHAGLSAGLYRSSQELAAQWKADIIFEPKMNEAEREDKIGGWQAAVRSVLAGQSIIK